MASEDVTEMYDDCLGNNERRILDVVDTQSKRLRTLYVGVINFV